MSKQHININQLNVFAAQSSPHSQLAAAPFLKKNLGQVVQNQRVVDNAVANLLSITYFQQLKTNKERYHRSCSGCMQSAGLSAPPSTFFPLKIWPIHRLCKTEQGVAVKVSCAQTFLCTFHIPQSRAQQNQSIEAQTNIQSQKEDLFVNEISNGKLTMYGLCLIMDGFIDSQSILIKMDFDFSVLSYKITQPQKQPLDDTCADEEETSNPFRRTSRLFKTINTKNSMSLYLPKSSKENVLDAKSQLDAAYSLENFQSFKDSKQLFESSQTCSFLGLQPSSTLNPFEHDQKLFFSKGSSTESKTRVIREKIIKKVNATERIHTEPCLSSEDNFEKGIFFLTAEEQSDSSIKQFYFNLKDQNQQYQTFNDNSPKKKEIKKAIYSFMDELELTHENSIDPQFVFKLKDVLAEIQDNKTNIQNSFKPKKWNKLPKCAKFSAQTQQNMPPQVKIVKPRSPMKENLPRNTRQEIVFGRPSCKPNIPGSGAKQKRWNF